MIILKYTRVVALLVFLTTALVANGQKVLMDERPVKTSTTNFGPNEKYFTQVSFSGGTLIGKGDSRLDINDLRSNDFTFGFRIKRKINGLLSVWVQPGFHYASYNINQGNGLSVTDSLFWNNNHMKHDRERFATESFNLNAFLRFNFDPNRGNWLGYYLDLGAGGDAFLGKEYLADDNKADGSKLASSYTNLPYMNTFGYNVFAKIGINWLAVTFSYRLNHVFKDQYGLPEPPVYSIGIEANPYSH